MTNAQWNGLNEWFDFEGKPTEAIALKAEAFERAVELSDGIANEAQQWQAYLNALAFFAFTDWFSDRNPDLTIESNLATLFQPEYVNGMNGLCHLKIRDFKICLIGTSDLNENTLTLPRATVEIPEFIPHFYLLIQIQEEQEIAKISGFIRYDQLARNWAALPPPDSDWTYSLSTAWLNPNLDDLLLYLRCLVPAGIPLPDIPANRLTTLAAMELELRNLLGQIGNRPWWEVLTWEQGVALLTNAHLLTTISEQQTEQQSINWVTRLTQMLQFVAQPAVNTALWLRDELDRVAEELSWVLLPGFSPTVAPMRSPTDELNTIIHQLQHQGMPIAPEARGAYQMLNFRGASLRLYAVSWPILSPENVPEWTLLLVLGNVFNTGLPPGTKLQVSDRTGILVERMAGENTTETHLYARTIGTWQESFWVTIALENGEQLTLAPFAFHPE